MNKTTSYSSSSSFSSCSPSSMNMSSSLSSSSPPSMTLPEMIINVRNSLDVLLNLVDRMKREAKCGENLLLVCAKLQEPVEEFIKKTTIQSKCILEFTNISKRYWTELTDRDTAAMKFNKRFSNNNNRTFSKDPNSVFNTIQTSIETIPLININESIMSRPKTYVYMDIIEEFEKSMNFIDASSSSSSSSSLNQPKTQNSTSYHASFIDTSSSSSSSSTKKSTNSTTTTNNMQLLAYYNSIIKANKLNSELMTTFEDDLKTIETYPIINERIYNVITPHFEDVKRVFHLQLKSITSNENLIESSYNEMKTCCDNINQSILQVINLIKIQQQHSKDYLLNIVLYWVKLNETQQQIIVKIGNQFILEKQQKQQQQQQQQQQQVNTTNNENKDKTNDNSKPKSSKLRTIF